MLTHSQPYRRYPTYIVRLDEANILVLTMPKPAIKLIVTGLKPDDIVKCSMIANKVRRYVAKYADIHILLTPNSTGFSGIIIEDENIIHCEDEAESIEKILEDIARVISRKKFIEPEIAAGKIIK